MKREAHNLTLAMIARDEEASIARCLASVRGLAEEVIVVDTGSNDRTVGIALEAGAEVVRFPWCDDFSAARNAGLNAATGRWILVLDADEYLPPASAEALRVLVTNPAPPSRGYQLLNKSSNDAGRTGMIGKIVRLFPNLPAVRYEWPVHEQVVTSLQRAGIPVTDTEIEIIHTGYASAGINAIKQARNLRILEAQTAAEGHLEPMTCFFTGGALLDLGRVDEALAAYSLCRGLSEGGKEIREAARVRMATCLVKLRRFEEALALAPQYPVAEWHPELMLLVAEASLARSDTPRGIALLHSAIESRFRPLIPAYDPIKTKIRCVMALSSLFQEKAPSSALGLIRLAAECLKAGREPRLAEVLAIESEL